MEFRSLNFTFFVVLAFGGELSSAVEKSPPEVCGLFGSVQERINDCQRVEVDEDFAANDWRLVSQFEVVVHGKIETRRAYLDEMHEAIWVKGHQESGRDLAESICSDPDNEHFRSLIGLGDPELSGKLGDDNVDWALPTRSDASSYMLLRSEPFGSSQEESRVRLFKETVFWLAENSNGYERYLDSDGYSGIDYLRDLEIPSLCVGHLVTKEYLLQVERETGFRVSAESSTYRAQLNEFLLGFNRLSEERRNAFRKRVGALTLSMRETKPEEKNKVHLEVDRVAGTILIQIRYTVVGARRLVNISQNIFPVIGEALVEARRIPPTVSVPKAPSEAEFDG